MPARPDPSPVVTAEPVEDRGPNSVERKHIKTGYGIRGRAEPFQVHVVGVGFPQPDKTRIRVELDDGAQRIRLVHADRVQ
jgi:hypothetical protein